MSGVEGGQMSDVAIKANAESSLAGARRLKIVFVINDLSGGGAEKLLQLIASFLADRGHEVSVVTLQTGNDAYDLAKSIQKLTLKPGLLTRGVGRVAALPLQARRLNALLSNLQPDICVGNLPRANLALLMTRWFGNQRPAIVTEHAITREAYRSSRVSDRVMRWLIGRFYAQADRVIAVSKAVQEGLAEFHVNEDQVHVVHNAVCLDTIRSLARQIPRGFPESELPTIISVGRHAPEKDQETLIRAFARLLKRVPARLVLVGQGPRRQNLEALVVELGIADAVLFAGWQENPFCWMARSDLFVLSSRFEGFGNVIVEAMACGLPVISTDCQGGPREILRGGEDGILVPMGDVEALANAMTTVLLDEEFRAGLAQKAQCRAAAFDISQIGIQYEELLQSVVRDQARPRPGSAGLDGIGRPTARAKA
jgi:glycosyltransferase involved in cell wall biosynthesis